ncbi:hypothetical protein ACSBR2_014155 [Camellia fascicularis]
MVSEPTLWSIECGSLAFLGAYGRAYELPTFQQGVNLLSGVRGEIEFIRDEFECMPAFLSVVDAKKENDQELKVWVKQVCDAAHGTKDVIDKFMLHLAHHHGNRFCGFLCEIPHFIKTIKAYHQIASKVQRIKSRSSIFPMDVRDTKIDMVY